MSTKSLTHIVTRNAEEEKKKTEDKTEPKANLCLARLPFVRLTILVPASLSIWSILVSCYLCLLCS